MDRQVTLLNLKPVHERGRPSRIVIYVALDYLKDKPVVQIDLTEREALRLARDAISAAVIVRDSQ